MNKCKSCAFLGDEITKEEWVDGKLQSIPCGFYECQRIKHEDYSLARGCKSNRIAHVVDGSDYFAALRVPEDFGCVYWEKKQ